MEWGLTRNTIRVCICIPSWKHNLNKIVSLHSIKYTQYVKLNTAETAKSTRNNIGHSVLLSI